MVVQGDIDLQARPQRGVRTPSLAILHAGLQNCRLRIAFFAGNVGLFIDVCGLMGDTMVADHAAARV